MCEVVFLMICFLCVFNVFLKDFLFFNIFNLVLVVVVNVCLVVDFSKFVKNFFFVWGLECFGWLCWCGGEFFFGEYL